MPAVPGSSPRRDRLYTPPTMHARWARPWFGATALAVLAGLVIQVAVTSTTSGGRFDTPIARGVNVFAFFTIQSNIIAGVTTLLLALDPNRPSTLFRTFRLTGLVAITLTFVVYHVALAHLLDLDSWALAADTILHTVVPVLTVLGWLVFGPRDATSPRIVGLSLLFPAVWMVFTLVRGAIIDWYPYPFIDVSALGAGRVVVNCFWILLLLLGIAWGAHALDQHLPRQPSVSAGTTSASGRA